MVLIPGIENESDYSFLNNYRIDSRWGIRGEQEAGLVKNIDHDQLKTNSFKSLEVDLFPDDADSFKLQSDSAHSVEFDVFP